VNTAKERLLKDAIEDVPDMENVLMENVNAQLAGVALIVASEFM